MFNLVLKDIFVQKKDLMKQAISWIVFIAILQFFGESSVYIITSYSTAISAIASSCGLGEKNEVDVMINSLPVSRKEIVISKYLSSLVFFIMSIIITTIFSAVIKLSGFSHINRFINLEDILISFVFTAVFTSIYITLYLWLGYFKAQMINGIFSTFMFVCLIIVVILVTFINNGTAVKVIMDFVSMPNFKLLMCLLSIIFSFIMIFVSIVVSLKVYSNREL